MSLGNGNIHQKGEIPEITKLYNNRIRVIRRFQKFTREDVDNTNLGSLMGDFGDLDTTGEQIVGQGYTDCRLISVEVDNRFNQQANADNPVLVKTYETLTGSFVQIDADVELTEQNGLKTVTKVFRAKTGTTSSGVVGTTTSGSLVLASSKIEDNGAFAELTEVFSEKGILNVETPKVGGVQQVVVTALGLSESLVTSELSQVTANHKLVNQATQNFNGFQTIAYTFEVDDFEVFVTEDGELTNVVKTELSSSSITRGTIGTTNITVSGKTFLLQKEELDNDGLIKKSIQTFIGLESASFPATQIFEIDSRYGVGLPIERQVVAPSEATGSVGATESVQVEPINSFSSVKFTATKASADAIASQVWYDRRNVTFPAQLKSIVAVGTESPVVVANYINAPTSPLKIKTTRTFHWGAPDDDSGTTERVFLDTSFSAAIEITTLTERTSESSSNSISSNKSISSSISNSENNSNSTSSSQNASNSSSTSNSTTNSSNSSENNSRTSASGNSSSTSSGTSTTSSTNTGTSSNSSTNSSTGTSTNNGTSNSSNNSSSTSSGSGSSSSTSTSENNSQNEGSSTSKASSKGISSTVSNTDTVGTSDTSTNVSSTSNSSTSSNSNTNSSANSTSSGSSNSRSSSQTSGNSNVASSGSSNSQVSSSGTSDVTTDSNGKSDSVVDSDVTIVSSQTNNDSTVTSDVDSRGDSDTEVNTTTQSAIDKPVYISATERNTKDRTTTSLINSYKHISSKVKTDVRGTGNSTTNTSSHNSNNSKSSTNSIIRSDNTNNTTSSTSNNNVISTSSTGNSSSTSDGSSNTTSSVSSNSSGSSASTVSSNNSVNGTSSGAVQSTTDSRSEGSSDNTVNSTSINVGSSAVSSSSTSNSNSSSTGTSSVQSITQSSNESSSQSSVESQNASRSQGEGQSQSTTQSATDSTSTSQSTSTGASESSNSGTSSSINNGTSNSSGTSSNSGTNNSTSSNSGTSNSNSTSNNEGESTSNGINKNTGKRIVTVNLRSCLRSSQTLSISGGVSGGGGSIAITGTSPTALPWGNYTEISRRSSHWRNGVWVREIEEALLPAEPV